MPLSVDVHGAMLNFIYKFFAFMFQLNSSDVNAAKHSNAEDDGEDQIYRDFLSRLDHSIDYDEADDEDFVPDASNGDDDASSTDSQSSIASEDLLNDEINEIDINRSVDVSVPNIIK